MPRYIDADKLVERINASPAFPNMGQDGYFIRDIVIDLIRKQPSVDTVKVRQSPKTKTIRKPFIPEIIQLTFSDLENDL